MNENKYLKFWKWAVILLVICNIGLLLAIWLKPHALFAPPRGEQPRDFVIHSLKFSDDQVKKYDALIQGHHSAMVRLHEESMRYRQLLFENLKNNDHGNSYADSLARLIANDQEQVEKITYDHFAQVRAICSDPQKAEFDKILFDVIKKMNGNGRGGPPPHGPDDHRDGGPPPPGDHPGPPGN